MSVGIANPALSTCKLHFEPPRCTWMMKDYLKFSVSAGSEGTSACAVLWGYSSWSCRQLLRRTDALRLRVHRQPRATKKRAALSAGISLQSNLSLSSSLPHGDVCPQASTVAGSARIARSPQPINGRRPLPSPAGRGGAQHSTAWHHLARRRHCGGRSLPAQRPHPGLERRVERSRAAEPRRAVRAGRVHPGQPAAA
eukprot:SAG11_NODE_3945_length_2137_cov_10.152601_1_plen_196_part_10